MITSIGTVTQVYIKFRDKKKENKKMGTNIEHITKYTHECGKNCVRIWKRREIRKRRAAARRNAPTLQRAIRVGPHPGEEKLVLNTGGLSVFFPSTPGVYQR